MLHWRHLFKEMYFTDVNVFPEIEIMKQNLKEKRCRDWISIVLIILNVRRCLEMKEIKYWNQFWMLCCRTIAYPFSQAKYFNRKKNSCMLAYFFIFLIFCRKPKISYFSIICFPFINHEQEITSLLKCCTVTCNF